MKSCKSLTSNEEFIVGKKGFYHDTACADVEGEAIEDLSVTVGAAVFENDHFTDKCYVIASLNEIVHEYQQSSALDLSNATLRLRKKHREDPTTLDPHIVDILRPIFDDVLLPHICIGTWSPFASLLSSAVYVLGTITGYKSLLSNEVFPHEYSLLERVVARLEDDELEWESKYVLCLWLSVLVMIPFEFKALGIARLAERICNVGNSLSGNGSIQKAASVMMGRFYSRADLECRTRLQTYLLEGDVNMSWLETVNKALGMIPLSFVNNTMMQDLFCRVAADPVVKSSLRNTKLVILIVASICKNLLQLTSESPNAHLNIVERGIEMILAHTSHPSGRIRESVAKGILRIASALPGLYREQFVQYLVEELKEEASDVEFHTKCLMIAELARRGYIQSRLLASAVNSGVISALEKERATLTSQIRDAGCAIVWSLARSGLTELYSSVLVPVLPSLVNVALFDKDINLRRSAAAAMQELIGRVGTQAFPEGMTVLNHIDFWSVANLNATYLEIPLQITRNLSGSDSREAAGIQPSRWNSVLRESMISHLLNEKLWDAKSSRDIQLLSSEALSRLLETQISEDSEKILSRLESVAVCENATAHDRFGAISTLRYVLKSTLELSEIHQSAIRNIVPLIDKKRLFRGKGGDSVRTACYSLIAEIAIQYRDGRLRFKTGSETKFVNKLLELVVEGIIHLVESVSLHACIAFRELTRIAGSEQIGPIVDSFSLRITSDACVNVAARRGMILALSLMFSQPVSVFDVLLTEAVQWPNHTVSKDLMDPMARRFALFGVIAGLEQNAFLDSSRQVAGLECVLKCTEDFETDKRGDVGSWVREVGLVAIPSLVSLESGNATVDAVKSSLCWALVAHCTERLDRVRHKTVEALRSLTCKSNTERKYESDWLSDILNLMIGIKVDGMMASNNLAGCCAVIPAPIQSEFHDVTNSNVFECVLAAIATESGEIMNENLCRICCHFAFCMSGLTQSSVSHNAERALLGFLSQKSAKAFAIVNVLISIFCLQQDVFLRFQNSADRLSRLDIPIINTLAAIMSAFPDILSDEQITQVFDQIHTSVQQQGFGPILTVHRLKSYATFVTRIVPQRRNYFEFLAKEVFLAGIPTVRYFVAMELIKEMTKSGHDEIVDILDSVDWLSENGWVSALESLCMQFGVSMPQWEPRCENLRYEGDKVDGMAVLKDENGYAAFVHEEHWLR